MQTHTYLVDHNHSCLIDLHLTRTPCHLSALLEFHLSTSLPTLPFFVLGPQESNRLDAMYVCMYVCMYVYAIHLVDWGKIPTGDESVLAADVESAAYLLSTPYYKL